MHYRKIAPRGLAQRYVKDFWILEDDAPSSEVQRILPDGRCELILNFAEPFEALGQGGWKKQPQYFLVGQITRPLLLRSRGPAAILGVSFHPECASRLLNISGQEVTERQVALEDISWGLLREIIPLHELGSWRSRLNALERALVTEAEKCRKEDRRVSFAVSAFEGSFGAASIRGVCERMGMTRRHFERRFKEFVGISPKLFCRMQRFQRVVRSLDGPNTSWADTAVACGYYDQAHLIRDFREFGGDTPATILKEEIDLARRFAH